MSQPLPGIEHVILLMFENRSFDNVLGAFYPGKPNRGGVPTGWSNPYQGQNIAAWQSPAGSAAQTIPYPDPNELFTNMQNQIAGGAMTGFVTDYATVPGATPSNIMQYYVAANVPVTYALAQSYAVSDTYFASGPVQTWPNRLFSLCGTPGYNPSTNAAYLNNTEYPLYPLIAGQLSYNSIFQQLDNADSSWRIYFADLLPVAMLLDYVWESGKKSPNKLVQFSPAFFNDITNNTLPAFSLVEPIYQMYGATGKVAPTSNHPGSSVATDSTGVPISVSCGERFLAQIFQALSANPALFAKTLLIVTYDEHGGLFDHVAPPKAVSPFVKPVTNFNYNSYGVRVPTLFINPYVQPGLFPPDSNANPPAFDHTSILATMRDQFGLSGSLSPRVDAAPTFSGLINPSQQPINAPTIPLPPCVWSPPPNLGHADPIVQSAIWQASHQGMHTWKKA